ncbi:MAG: extracellular solute-binding protein, partial [Casimicrobiaceae bacterium]
MQIRHFAVVTAIAVSATLSPSASAQLNVLCSVQVEWCTAAMAAFEKQTGIKVSMTQKGSGESIAQISAEKENPKTDIWFGGTGDPHLQAAELGLSAPYQSPMLDQLHPWAKGQWTISGQRTVGIYAGALGIGYNPEVLAKKKLAIPKCWADLIKPEYKGEIQMANPNASGTAYTAIATLVQLMGEDQAFDYLKKLHANINNYPRSGTAPIKA